MRAEEAKEVAHGTPLGVSRPFADYMSMQSTAAASATSPARAPDGGEKDCERRNVHKCDEANQISSIEERFT